MRESTEADVVFERIFIDYPVWERAVRDAAPELPDSEVQDRALRSVLAQLRLDPSTDTLAHLKERLARARSEAFTMRENGMERRERDRSLATVVSRHEAGPGARGFRDAEGRFWSVRELLTDDVAWGRGQRCLVFSSEMAVRRVWGVPADWRSLSDAELEQLSWST